jgi:rod shape-determining protein MreC
MPNSEKKLFSKTILWFFVLVILFFINRSGMLSGVKNLAAMIFSSGAGYFRNGAVEQTGTIRTIFSFKKIQKENERLKSLEIETISLREEKEELLKENGELRKEIAIAPQEGFSLISAEVIYQEPGLENDFLVINKGSNAGLEKGLAVITGGKFLVGEVYETTPEKSKIMLSVSRLSTFDAALRQSGVSGIAKGRYGLEILLDLIPSQTNLEKGELVVTAGKNKNRPENLIVGEVISFAQSSDGLFKQAVLKPFYSIDKLRFVAVVKKQ